MGLFGEITTLRHIDSVSRDFIPSSPNTGPSEEHLFINCIYSGYAEETAPETQFEQFRDDATAALAIVTKNELRDLFKSVVVSFLILPALGTNLRIYCVRVSSSCLEMVNSKTLSALAEHESSNLPRIADLLGKQQGSSSTN